MERKEVKQQVVIICLLLSVVLMLGFCLVIKWDKERTKSFDPEGLEGDERIVYQIESVDIGQYVTINGYAYMTGEGIATVENAVVLYCRETGESIQIPTAMQTREDMYDVDGMDYTYAGFLGKVPAKKLKTDSYSYEICLYYANNGYEFFVSTGEILGSVSEAS